MHLSSYKGHKTLLVVFYLRKKLEGLTESIVKELIDYQPIEVKTKND